MTGVSNNDDCADALLIARYERLGNRCGQFAIALGLAVLLGWAAGIVTLTNIVRGRVSIQPNTAICLILSGTASLGARTAGISRQWRIVQIGSATLMLVVALATLAEYFLGIHLRIDQLFHTGSSDLRHVSFPGRMGPDGGRDRNT